MSKVKCVLEIEPTELCGGDGSQESRVVSGFDCPYCHGEGYIWRYDAKDEKDQVPCDHCKGTGHLTAVIKVAWKAPE
jgi:DnaJ-class molecular chaperone